MKKYMLVFIITIPILLVVWNMTDSAEEPKNTINSTAEEKHGHRSSLLQDKNIIVSVPGMESVDEQGQTDMVSLPDVLREIEEYRSKFIESYTSNALSDEFPDVEPEMIIEEHDFPSDSSEDASLTVYSGQWGKHLRYELHYYRETGNSVINYYLCKNFVWVSRQNNYYSSQTLSAEYSDILYSTIENWIITDDAAYIMHDNGELEETDRARLESEIYMPDEVAAIGNEQKQIEKFYQIAEEDCGLSREETQRWFDIIMEDDILDGGVRAIRDLIFDDIDSNGVTDMVIMVNEPEMEYMFGTGALYFYMNADEPYCFEDEDFPFFFPLNICYGDLNEDGNVEIAFALRGTGNGGSGDWHKALLSYTGGTMERLEIPSDQEPDYYGDRRVVDEGFTVRVIMEPEPETYTAYCPYLEESITFHASNGWDGDTQKAYLAEAPQIAGCNLRGFYNLQIVDWEGRDALQVTEYLSGEGGNAHCVGWAYFILIWDEQGNGSVADWWVEGNLGDSGLIFYSAEDLLL